MRLKAMSTKSKITRETREEVPVREINGAGSGNQIKNIVPDDEKSVGKELFEKGMRAPTRDSKADDQRRK
jgi:hypothetical protein